MAEQRQRYQQNKNRPQRGPGSRPVGFSMKGGMAQNAASIKRLLAFLFSNYKIHLGVVVVCLITAALVQLTSTLFMRELIDSYVLPLLEQASPDFAPLANRLVRLIAVLLIGVVCNYTWNRTMVSVTQGVMYRLRVEMFEEMESLPIRYFDTHSHGDIMSVYTNDIDTLRQLISQSFPQLLNSFIQLTSTFISMVVLDIPLTVVSVLMVGVMLMTMGKLGGYSAKYFGKQQNDIGQLNGFIEEMVNGQKVVKVFCHEEQNLKDFAVLNNELRDSANNAHKVANIMMPINANLGNISYVLCAVIGAVLAVNGFAGLTIGTLVAFLNLNRSFSMPITQISQQMNAIIMAGAGAERVFRLRDEEPEKDEGYVELVRCRIDEQGNITECKERTGTWAWKHPHQADGTVTYTQMKGEIVFTDVDFGYTENKVVLHDINMYAKPGQKIAFVGSTGAGKTTITNLINRFYDIQDGKIRYDGININKIKKGELRRSLGVVLQDTHLFTGTVMENIRYGRLAATDEECIEAAKLANADGFIRRLPDGYNTMLVNDGSNLSQGQRQLLAIARAAVADPPVLILDEATSSIDTRTEQLVQRGMDALMSGRTSFVIAHRLSTVRDADCIMVLEKGRIIERGNHDQLMELKGRYYHLYTGNQISA